MVKYMLVTFYKVKNMDLKFTTIMGANILENGMKV